MPEQEDPAPERRSSSGWEDLQQVIAGVRQAMERGAVIISEGVAAVNDWFARHQPEIAELSRLSQQAGEWFARHREEIAAFATWAAVGQACKEADLYAPMSPAWWHIAENAADKDAAALDELILTAYAPGGPGYEALRDELLAADVLANRRAEVQEVLASLEEGRHYVAICGALPLAEGVLSATHGRWRKQIGDYPLKQRLHEDEGLTQDQVADLILNRSALDMAVNAADGIWRSGPHRVGTFTTKLNRNVALHGTGYGWHTQHNAVRSALLLAAMARVAGPLLGPLPTGDGNDVDAADGSPPAE